MGLLGPNGSGKTTLMKLINGLLVPNQGKILVNGFAPGPESKKRVSYLPDASYLPDWMQVQDLVKMFADFYADFDAAKAAEMLQTLKISGTERLKTCLLYTSAQVMRSRQKREKSLWKRERWLLFGSTRRGTSAR